MRRHRRHPALDGGHCACAAHLLDGQPRQPHVVQLVMGFQHCIQACARFILAAQALPRHQQQLQHLAVFRLGVQQRQQMVQRLQRLAVAQRQLTGQATHRRHVQLRLLQGDLRASAGLLLLEQAAQRRAELRARDVLKRQLLGAPDSAQARNLRGLLEQSGQWLRPGTLLHGDGYGLPLADEQALLMQAVATASAQAVPAWQALRLQLRQQLPVNQREEMDAIDANLAALGAHLRTQAASSPTGAADR
ncbi:hypothetical protein G6F24_013924 [Rhizopus arrhizus]|nr:hypothetical protein G6F24_013924 [Rhizopus arrhizus]